MAFVFSVSGYLPGFIRDELMNPPIESVEVKSFAIEGILGNGNEGSRVFFSYDEWAEFSGNFKGKDAKEYAERFDKSFFKDHNLAVADISMPDTACLVYVESAEEKSNVLELEYRLVTEYGMVGFTVICYETVFAVTSKLVSEVKTTQLEDVTAPMTELGLFEKSYNALYGKNNAWVFDNYDEWSKFKKESEINTNGFNDIYDKYFFMLHNLAVVTIGYGDMRYTSQYVDSCVEDGVLKVEYYDLQAHPDNAAMPCEPVTETLFIVTGKDASSAEAVCLGRLEYEEPETGVIGIYTADYFYDDENTCSVFSDYESWIDYCVSNYYTYKDDSLKNAIDKDFFLKNNLVAATVTLPDLGGHDVYINSVEEKGASVNIEYSLIGHMGAYPDSIEFGVILYATDKFVKNATCTKVEYPYYQEEIIATVDATGGDKEEILLFKDSESWENFKSTTAWQFTGYEEIVDEDYFEHNNLMITFIELPSSQHEIDWVENTEGCGVLNFRLTQPEGETDGKVRYKAVICTTCKRVEEPALIESTP